MLGFLWLSTETDQQVLLSNHKVAARFIKRTAYVTVYIFGTLLLADLMFYPKLIVIVLQHIDTFDLSSALYLSAQILDDYCLAGVVAILCYDRVIVQFGYPPP